MQAMVQKRYLELNPPGDGDNRADFDRLTDALRPEFGAVRVPYRLLRAQFDAIRRADFRVTATLIAEDDGWALAGIQSGDTTARRFGLACDLGSTTVAVQLIDLTSGAVISSASGVNGQIVHGTDILSRIFYTQESGMEAQRRDEIRSLTVSTIDDLISEVLDDIDPADCPLLIVSGNTTMIHFLLGVDAFCVFSAPFAPMFNRAPFMDSRELGFGYDGRVYCFPSSANYLGGDVISGLWSVGLTESDKMSMFIDIGTNGEMAIGSREFLIGGAGAAGPALEGGISKFGMRAAPGAVDSVRIENGELRATTIANAPAKGICGSGIVDLLAQMRVHGWMNLTGRLEPEASDAIIEVPLDGVDGTELAVIYAHDESGRPLTFTQTDIFQFADTKAAAATMIACLLEATGADPMQLDRIYLAGAFCEHLDLESSITIGLYPDLPREKFVLVGNSSLSGARKLLLDRRGLALADRIAADLYYLEFAMQPDFLTLMTSMRGMQRIAG